MTAAKPLSRRRVLVAGLSAAALLGARSAGAAVLATPSAGTGPFYPESLPLDSDADLVQVAGRPDRAAGEVTHLFGRLLDREGAPISGARVEIWQCDAGGVYHHSRDRRFGEADENFQGFGAAKTSGGGEYRFRTIKPVPYPSRTPHIHFRILAPGHAPFTTQMYVAGHPLNADDILFRRIAADERGRVTVAFVPAPEIEAGALMAGFDIALPA